MIQRVLRFGDAERMARFELKATTGESKRNIIDRIIGSILIDSPPKLNDLRNAQGRNNTSRSFPLPFSLSLSLSLSRFFYWNAG